jgi:hypothetical protein
MFALLVEGLANGGADTSAVAELPSAFASANGQAGSSNSH